MPELSYRCPKCGNSSTYSPKRGGLCENCFKLEQKKKLNSFEIKSEICYNCGRVKIGDLWLGRIDLNRKLRKRIEDKIEGVSVHFSLSKDEYEILIRKKVHSFTYKAEANGIFIGKCNFLLNLQPQLCQECSKKFSGDLNEAVLYIRVSDEIEAKMERVIQEIKRIFAKGGRGEYIEVEKVSKGIDVFLSSREMSKKIEGVLRNRFSAEIESYSEKKKDETLGKTRTIKKVKINL